MSEARAPRRDARVTAPGRSCPVSYRYPPAVFRREAEIHADTLYVVGGLYGNVEALRAVEALAAEEPTPPVIVFNGDFHWFDVAPADFMAIDAGTAAHRRIRGNVETEIAGEDAGAGCGCAYPMDVSDADVERSNAILERLREVSRRFAPARAALGALPMHALAQVGPLRVGIVHGDAASLAGWGFAQDALENPVHARWIANAFRQSGVDLFASSHTCLPVLGRMEVDGRIHAIANNGAAGMPNFRGARHGLVTRVGLAPSPRGLYGCEMEGVHVQAVPVAYDAAAWDARFLASWPAGTPAHVSYWRRMAEGPRFEPAQALRSLAA